MKRILLLALSILPLMAACDKDKPEEEEKVSIKLDVTNLTDDGYFDGLLYYKVTSNSPCEVSVNKVEKTATMVEIPSRIEINGNIYSCTSIEDDAFYECGKLSSIVIPNTIRSIGARSFYRCLLLNKITISEGITSIGNSAFYGCSGLTSITIPESVTSIGFFSFYDCRKLTSVVCKGITPPTSGWKVFTVYNDDYQDYRPYCQSVTLYVPKGSKKAYQNSEPWNTFKEIIEQ